MAIVIRTPRGEITTPQITQGRNQLAAAISTRRDTSKPLKAIEQAIRYKQEYDARIDRENLINIETDYEANTSLQTFKKLEEIKQRLKDEELTEETLNNIADDYGKELDKSHISKFKNNKAALERTNSIKNSQKLLFMREVFKYKDSRILGKIVEREETGKKLIFQDLETRVKNFRNDPAALAILESTKKRYLTKYGNALIQSSGKQNKTLEGLQEVENKFYEEIIIHRNPQTREIDFEKTLSFLKKNRIADKPIPQNQRDRIKNFVSERMNEEAMLERRKDEREDIEITNIIEKEFPNLTIDKIEQLKKNKGPKTVNYLNTVKEVLVNERKGIKSEVQLEDLNEINEMIINDRITNIDQPFSLSSDDLNEPQKSIAQRQKDIGLDNFADFKKTLFTQMSAEDKELEDEFKKFIKK